MESTAGIFCSFGLDDRGVIALIPVEVDPLKLERARV